MPTPPRRLRGTVRHHADGDQCAGVSAGRAGLHLWRPIAPRAAVEVRLDEPALGWRGEGYLDTNAGSEPLEDAFVDWDWSRAHLKRDSVALYDLKRRDGSGMNLALRFDASGRAEEMDPPPQVRLPGTLWRVARSSRADAGHGVRVDRTWEDTPFYARSAITTHLYGEPAHGVHESLSLDRFRSPWVRGILPFRMPRALR
jgi:carotenoid 1,2-hydratase